MCNTRIFPGSAISVARKFGCNCSGCLVEEESKKCLELLSKIDWRYYFLFHDASCEEKSSWTKFLNHKFHNFMVIGIYPCVYMSWQLISWLLTLSEEAFQSRWKQKKSQPAPGWPCVVNTDAGLLLSTCSQRVQSEGQSVPSVQK